MRSEYKQGVNIVAFGNLFQLLRSFILGWDFQAISEEVAKRKIALMMLPVRGSRKSLNHEMMKCTVVALEEAWNHSTLGAALIKLFGDLKYVISGSPSKVPGASKLDRISGMNFSDKGTIVDWLLFGNKKEASLGFVTLLKLWPKAIISHHSPHGNSGVVEIHPEFRRLICKNLHIGHTKFVEWIMSSNRNYCIDTFHTFSRGSRDGLEPNPVVPENMRRQFLEAMVSKTPEVHFRLNKYEVELILSGRVKELPLYSEMMFMYQNYDAIFVLEIYPDIFSTVSATAVKVRRIWDILDSEFR
ncbi:MAG: hypothetical protein EBV07_01550 [Proteobacteria bacterium]|nr:hypothetical protein [Pseudomonadota bacterium]